MRPHFHYTAALAVLSLFRVWLGGGQESPQSLAVAFVMALVAIVYVVRIVKGDVLPLGVTARSSRRSETLEP